MRSLKLSAVLVIPLLAVKFSLNTTAFIGMLEENIMTFTEVVPTHSEMDHRRPKLTIREIVKLDFVL